MLFAEPPTTGSLTFELQNNSVSILSISLVNDLTSLQATAPLAGAGSVLTVHALRMGTSRCAFGSVNADLNLTGAVDRPLQGIFQIQATHPNRTVTIRMHGPAMSNPSNLTVNNALKVGLGGAVDVYFSESMRRLSVGAGLGLGIPIEQPVLYAPVRLRGDNNTFLIDGGTMYAAQGAIIPGSFRPVAPLASGAKLYLDGCTIDCAAAFTGFEPMLCTYSPIA